VSFSDHRYIQFTVTGIDCSVEVYRNPPRTEWESLRTDMSGCLCKITDKITDLADLETAAEQFQHVVAFTYKENCPLTVRRNDRNLSWWNQEHTEKEESSQTI
jgi:hypothetical protein